MTGLPESKERRVFNNVLGAMGNTPLVKLERIGKDLPVPLYAKLEFMNPGGSVKDRVGANIVEQAEKRGEIKPGGTIVEATSGNTGVGLAIAPALKARRGRRIPLRPPVARNGYRIVASSRSSRRARRLA